MDTSLRQTHGIGLQGVCLRGSRLYTNLQGPKAPGLHQFCMTQHAKKVVSDNQGLVDFAIRLVNSVLNLPDRQVKFFREFKLQYNCEINSTCKKVFEAT